MRKVSSAITMAVLFVLFSMSGCDKKASVSTIGLMDSAAKQSRDIADSVNTMNRFKFDGTEEDVAYLNEAWVDLEAIVDQTSLGFSKGSEALQAKRRLSEEAAKQVTNSVETIIATTKVLKRLCSFMVPKTPDDVVPLDIWRTQIIERLNVLAATVAQLDTSIQADMAAGQK